MIIHTEEMIKQAPYASTYFRPPAYFHGSTFYKVTVFYGGTTKISFYSRKGGPIKKVIMKRGDSFIITPKDYHYFEALDEKDYCFRDIYFYESNAKELCDAVVDGLYDKIMSDEYPQVFNVSQNFLSYYAEEHSKIVFKQKNKDCDNIHKMCLFNLLGQYLQKRKQEEAVYPEWLMNLLACMADETFVLKSIEEISQSTYFSHGYLSRQFKHYMNMSLKQYVVERKLAYSCNLLTNSKESVEEIALRFNFSTRSNYIKAFKEKYGITPHKYRLGNFFQNDTPEKK